jgi:hypothetical protein
LSATGSANKTTDNLNNNRISRSIAALNLAKAVQAYLSVHPEDCGNINLMGHSHGGNVIIEALSILQSWGIKAHEVALFATPVRSDYVIPQGSASKVYNIYSQQHVAYDLPSVKASASLSVEAELDVDVNFNKGGIKFRMPSLSNPNPIQVTPPSIDVDVNASIDIDASASVEVNTGSIEVSGDFVPIAACTDNINGLVYNVCGVAGQTRDDSNVQVVNINVPGLNVTSAHSDIKNPENLKSSSDVCNNIPGYCD